MQAVNQIFIAWEGVNWIPAILFDITEVTNCNIVADPPMI